MGYRGIVSAGLLAVLLLGSCATADDPGLEGSPPAGSPEESPTESPEIVDVAGTFTAELSGLNGSGVEGTVELSLEGTALAATITATGLEPDKEHLQHIHGFGGTKVSSCPDTDLDENDDGIISVAEGQPAYGPVIQGLAPMPTASADGSISYQSTVEVSENVLGDLGNRVVVLHGLTVEGNYDASVPVACGRLSPA